MSNFNGFCVSFGLSFMVCLVVRRKCEERKMRERVWKERNIGDLMYWLLQDKNNRNRREKMCLTFKNTKITSY